MNTVNLKITGTQHLSDVVVSINDQPVKLKLNQFDNLVGTVQVEQPSAKIKIYKMLDVGGIGWFITQLFFFVISVFGLLDVRMRNRDLGVLYESEFQLNGDTEMTLRANLPRNQAPAFTVESDATVIEHSNLYTVDAKAKRTLKLLRWAKVLLALAIIGVVIAVVAAKL